MNGSLPPSSRLTRATRSAQTPAIRLPRLDRAGERDAVDALVADDRLAHVARAGEQVDDAGRQVVEAGRERERRQRRQLRRLADGRVAGGERGRELPREQQQRVVPGDDAARRRRSAPSARARAASTRSTGSRGRAKLRPDLGVVVERGRRPADLVRVLEPAACRPRASSARRARRCARGAGSRPRAAARRARPPASPPSRAPPRAPPRPPRRPARRSRPRDGRDRLLRERVLDVERASRRRRTCSPPMSSRVSVNPAWPSRA